MSNASTATITLLAITLVSVLTAWAITSEQDKYAEKVVEINEMNCDELLEYILSADSGSLSAQHAKERYMLERCLE